MARITKEPEQRKAEILETAMRLFYENGYEKTSMADIAKAMHVAQGLCYRYFPSKEVLFDTAIDQFAQRQVDLLTHGLQPGMSLKQLVQQMPAFFEVESDDSYVNKFCHGPESAKIHNQLSMRICAKIEPVILKALAASNARGETNIPDIRAAASFCVYGQLGLLLDGSLPPEERSERIKAFLLDLLEKF